MGWLTDAVDFGDDLFKSVGVDVGAVWDWGSKNQAALSGVVGVGTGVMNYMAQKNAPVPGEADREYMERRRAEHNQGITKAAEEYKKPKGVLGGI